MSLNSSRRYGLRPDQFEMAQMIGLIALAAVLDFLLLLYSDRGMYFMLMYVMLQFPVALSAVVLGLRSIATKQPVLFRARWHATFIIVGLFLPGMMLGVVPNFSSPYAKTVLVVDPTINFLNAAAILCSVCMWVWSRGYLAFGVTNAPFREGLRAALKKLDLPYEESGGVIRLPTVGAELDARVNGLSAGIWVKPHKFAPLLEEIVKEMNDYYRSSSVQANKTHARWVVILGTIWMAWMVLMGSVMLYGGVFRIS